MDRPPGYDDENIHYLPTNGQQMRLLQGADDHPHRIPSSPHRSYQPGNPYQPVERSPTPPHMRMAGGSTVSYNPTIGGSAISYNPPGMQSDSAVSYNPTLGGSAVSYNPQPANLPSYGESPTRSYSPSPSLSPTRRDYAYSPTPSRMENRPYSRGAESERPWTATSREGERSWTPARREWRRPPPASVPYEPVDINGYPRPGTPGSIRSGYSMASSRRPLPPAPVFSEAAPAFSGNIRSSNLAEETVLPMPEEEQYPYEDDESVFGPGGSEGSLDMRRPRSPSTMKSFETGSTAAAMEDDTDLDEKPPMTSTKQGEHYGPAPETRQRRRGLNRQAMMTKKQVKLINGELILDCKIPSILYSFLPRRDENEFTHMRYTAVTCDPDDFVKRGYMLRQNMDPTRRETELFICITMFNEDELCFTRSMHGVMRNIAHLCARTKSRVWGKDGWQKIVVCVVADGRKKVHPRVLDALAAMGVYQDGIAKNLVNGREVTAHVYEYTTQVSLDADLKFKGAEKGIVPVQMIFCLKEKNQKKLNSHRWFFNAFGPTLNPNVCILLDVGTRPGKDSLYHLWKAFDNDSQVAGACGEIKAMKGKGFIGLFNPLVASQNFEYKMSNILDKPLESVLGYITVLPGALSAYRYYALQNDETGNGPLTQYFKGEELHGKDVDVFTANMYLAEDRILCWELVAKKDERWVLKYVRAATGETDVPDAVPEFISQRRRWLNGAFFAAIYSLVHFRQIWTTDHTIVRKVLLHIEFIYQFAQLLFTFFGLANFYLSFYFIAGSLSDARLDPFGHGWGQRIFVILKFICILLICTQFILCMGNRPQGAKRMFMGSMIAYGFIMTYTTFCAVYIVIKYFSGDMGGEKTTLTIGNNIFTNLIVSTGSTIGVYFLMSFLYMDPWHMFTSAGQYFMMLPSYLCTLQVYAFCNTHDVSWGTKGSDKVHTDLGAAIAAKGDTVELEMPSEQLDIDSGYDEALRNLRDRLEVAMPPMSEDQIKEDYYRAFRTYVVVVWMVANAMLAMIVTAVYQINDVRGNAYLTFLLWSVAVLAVFRAIGSTAYLIILGLHAFVEGKVKLDPERIRQRFRPQWKRKLNLTTGVNPR